MISIDRRHLPFVSWDSHVIIQASRNSRGHKAKGNGLIGAYLSTVFLTLTHPATIISYTVIFAGLGFANTNGHYFAAAFLVCGVFLGSASWWLTLSTGIGLLRERCTPDWIVWVNRIAGAVIMVFGIPAPTTLQIYFCEAYRHHQGYN